jgi:hypothetical protein
MCFVSLVIYVQIVHKALVSFLLSHIGYVIYGIIFWLWTKNRDQYFEGFIRFSSPPWLQRCLCVYTGRIWFIFCISVFIRYRSVPGEYNQYGLFSGGGLISENHWCERHCWVVFSCMSLSLFASRVFPVSASCLYIAIYIQNTTNCMNMWGKFKFKKHRIKLAQINPE